MLEKEEEYEGQSNISRTERKKNRSGFYLIDKTAVLLQDKTFLKFSR